MYALRKISSTGVVDKLLSWALSGVSLLPSRVNALIFSGADSRLGVAHLRFGFTSLVFVELFFSRGFSLLQLLLLARFRIRTRRMLVPLVPERLLWLRLNLRRAAGEGSRAVVLFGVLALQRSAGRRLVAPRRRPRLLQLWGGKVHYCRVDRFSRRGGAGRARVGAESGGSGRRRARERRRRGGRWRCLNRELEVRMVYVRID